MKCSICRHGDTQPGKATATLNRGESVVVIKDVPADICENCGEYYLSETVSERVLSLAEDAASKGTEVEILRYAA